MDVPKLNLQMASGDMLSINSLHLIPSRWASTSDQWGHIHNPYKWSCTLLITIVGAHFALCLERGLIISIWFLIDTDSV